MIDVYNLLVGDSLVLHGNLGAGSSGDRWEFLEFAPCLGDAREVLARNQRTDEYRLFLVQTTPRGLVAHPEVHALGGYSYDLSAIEAMRRGPCP